MKNMIKADPFIAVTEIEASSKWYQKLFGCKCYGRDIKILTDESGSVLLGLHKWREDQHPTMIDENLTPGNGLMLYFRVSKLEKMRNR